MKTVTVALLALAVLAPGTAFSAYTYEVDRSAPCVIGCSGNVELEGFVEVDSLGLLTSSNFVDWELILNSTNHANTVLAPDNSQVIFFVGSNFVEATLNELIITMDGSAPSEAVFLIRGSGGRPFLVDWILEGGGLFDAEEVFTNSPDGIIDQAIFTSPDNFIQVVLPATTIIPIPAALPLLGTGLAVLGFLGWRSRRGVSAC